ncbi:MULTISPECIES: ketopantoate reductase family protein [unclassified Streptomyces]|uniref:ketopantoate reductase family protein n=1 Tax=unclassified Streptomyces TaxID=2593676 RepID=UPI00081E4CF0|nr:MULTISPECIES: ketopantoate reductase family protein [unclassified Streptomyces]MYZ34598.1 2-dehydropantoate 2-reductase [Streptomyces sp. SID4917]SCF68555.1 2-dehydropantoate 2-reductase [Streptomyces sp. MnatMP-M17]
MRLLVVGAGATGGYFGARLVRAGRDVTFLVRPGRAAVLRERGLRIVGSGEDDRIDARLVTAAELRDSGGSYGSYDVVLVSVKATALAQAMEDIAPAVGPSTAILPVLNGMAHLDRLSDRFGTASVLGGVALLATSVDARGDIAVLAPGAKLTLGDQRGGAVRTADSPAGRAFDLLDGAGFEVTVSENILAEMWHKWVFIATAGAITCLMRGTIGDVASVPGGTEYAKAVLAETAAVSAAAGFPLAEERRATTEGTLTQPGSPFAPSFYRDVTAGRSTEVEHVFGDLTRRAAELSVATPLMDLATMNLRVYEHRYGLGLRSAS